jgi:hypothetical protein
VYSPAEDPEHADPLVAAQGGPLPVDQLLRARDRRREADAVLRPVDVVVHRLGNRDQRQAALVERRRERQRVVAADGHEVGEAEVLDRVEHVVGEVVDALVRLRVRDRRRVQPRRQGLRPHPARVGARRVEDRAARAVDGASVDAVQDPDVLGIELRAPALVREALPAAPDAQHLEAEVGRAVDDALDHRVEAGNVAAPGEDADASRCSHGGLRWITGRAPAWYGVETIG